MNKEEFIKQRCEIDKITEEEFEREMGSTEPLLEEEIERLNNIIGEAIEYIELWHYRNDFRVNSFTKGVKEELLEILKGSE